MPDAGAYLWSWFWQLHRGRQAGFSGPLPISSAEMAAWASLHRHDIIPREWDVLCKMDMAFLKAIFAKHQPTPEPDKPKVSARPLSPALFDAILK